MAVLTCSFYVVLMIFLCHIEFLSHFYLSHYWFRKVCCLFLHKLLCNLELLFIYTPYPAAILCAEVWPLTIYLCWIMHHEKTFQKLPKCDLFWVESHLNCLSMPSFCVTNFFIVRIFKVSLLIATLCCYHARSYLESMLYTPETATRKICNLKAFTTLGLCLSFYHQ